MSIRKPPAGCKTPARDREMYVLTKKDAQFMLDNAKAIWDMLCYYSNMPENKTGEIQSGAAASEVLMNELFPTIESILDELNCMVLN